MSSWWNQPLCFVLMPFGTKRDHDSGGVVEFDDVYQHIIKPAVEKAGLQCIRADEEKLGGIIHKPMYERLLLCDYAVADLSAANANVYYELGIRHAARPYSTVLTFAEGFRIPFDLGPLRGLPYHLDETGKPSDADADADALTQKLRAAREMTRKMTATADSPLFQLLDGLEPPDLQLLDAYAFRERVTRNEQLKRRIRGASSDDALTAVRAELSDDLEGVGAGVLVDLLLAYRDHEMYDEMTKLVDDMPAVVATKARVREQEALALNRSGKPDLAQQVIEELQKERGPSTESWGILGRIYKDRWEEVAENGDGEIAARGWLDEAIKAYNNGFETDWRAHYPGINAVQLMWIKDRSDQRWQELLPVVRYSAMQAVKSAKPNYWDFATMMETAIYREDMDEAVSWLTKAVTARPTQMAANSTLTTIKRLRKIIDPEKSDRRWDRIEGALRAAAKTADQKT